MNLCHRPGGGKQMLQEYQQFRELLPSMCTDAKLTVEELTFDDFVIFASGYIAQLREAPAPAAEAILVLA